MKIQVRGLLILALFSLSMVSQVRSENEIVQELRKLRELQERQENERFWKQIGDSFSKGSEKKEASFVDFAAAALALAIGGLWAVECWQNTTRTN